MLIIPGNISVGCEAYVESSMDAPSPVVIPTQIDDSLQASLRWLESGNMNNGERQAIVDASSDASLKMAAFRHMMGIRRASRLVRTQGWLDMVQDRLLSDDIVAKMQNDPYLTLSIARYLRDLQADDTAYITDLAKRDDSNSLAAARVAASKPVNEPSDAVSAKAAIAALPPHRREKLRKMVEMLTMPDAEKKTTPPA